MRLSWQQLIRKKLQGRPAFYSIGIAFSAEGVLLCGFKQRGNDICWEIDASFSHHNWATQLADFVEKNKLANTPCYVSVTSHWYQILQVDKPNVPTQDVHAALQWPIKDFLPANVDYVYDYAEQPVQVSGQNKVIVVALPLKDVLSISKGVLEANLDLKSIMVEETASVELTPVQDEAVLTLVQEHGEEIVLNIVKQGRLYFSRRLKGFENLGSFSHQELSMGIIESLCIQIQRSMDFFESQLREAPVKQVLIKLDTTIPEQLVEMIHEAMEIDVAVLSPEIICAPHLDFKMASFSCLGAAYTPYSMTKTKHVVRGES